MAHVLSFQFQVQTFLNSAAEEGPINEYNDSKTIPFVSINAVDDTPLGILKGFESTSSCSSFNIYDHSGIALFSNCSPRSF